MRFCLLLAAAGLAGGALYLYAAAGTPITVGDGSIRVGPAKVLRDGEWDDVGSGVKKRRAGPGRIKSVTATGAGVTTTPKADCAPGRNCTLTVVFNNSGPGPSFVTVTVSSDRGPRGIHIASSIPFDEFDWNGADGVVSGQFRVVSAEFASGNDRTRLCASSGCTVTIDFP